MTIAIDFKLMQAVIVMDFKIFRLYLETAIV